MRSNISRMLVGCAAVVALTGCGDAPSRLFRQGQLPKYNFPLYVTTTTGVQSCPIDAPTKGCKLIPEGAALVLTNPQGVATDSFKNIWIVDRDNNRIVKCTEGKSPCDLNPFPGLVLNQPQVIAVDSSNQVYVGEDNGGRVIRANDGKVIKNYGTPVFGLAFGLNDEMIVALRDLNRVDFGAGPNAVSVTVDEPTNASVDSTGRVYVAEGLTTGGEIFRFKQDGSGTPVTLAGNLSGTFGVAVDAAENVYFVEQANARLMIRKVGASAIEVFRNDLFNASYIAFTRY